MVRGPCYSLTLERGKILAPHSTFANTDGAAVCPEVSGWSRVVVFYKFPVLLGCPPPGPLASESKLFVGAVCLHPLALPGCCSKSWLQETKSKLSELTTVSSRSRASLPSLHLSSLPAVVSQLPRLHLVGGMGEGTAPPFSQQWNSLLSVFKQVRL